jgi:hypothetical protein
MKRTSIIEDRGPIAAMPEFTGERVYMRRLDLKSAFPADLGRWESVVNSMLRGIDVPIVYLMVDQSFVPAGSTQRRPGLHVDGYWVANDASHGGSPGRHSGSPSHAPEPSPEPSHKPSKGGVHDFADWANAAFDAPEAILLASDVAASRAFVGEWDGQIGDGGSCATDVTGLEEIVLQAGRCYAGNVACLHESLPVAAACHRTLVRLNVPGWTP